jgi:hypothetical protein
MLNHLSSKEIYIENKQAIRQLYKQAYFMLVHLSTLYNVSKSTINRMFRYD